MKWLLIGLVRGYQLVISPLLGPTCRYYPSCSAYAVEALQVHGAVKGTWLAIRRLLRCHPWSPGGVDHVPPRRQRGPRGAAPGAGTAEQPPGPTSECSSHSPDSAPAIAGVLHPQQGA